jgi:hypothetical protein
MPYDLEYIDLELKDTPESNLLEALDQAIKFLKQKREESKVFKCFINCTNIFNLKTSALSVMSRQKCSYRSEEIIG